jgi:hypothetical protein
MKANDSALATEYLRESKTEFEKLKRLGEKVFEQLAEKDFHWSPDAETNSIAITMQHLFGNMISRWSDMLTTDGEKESRDRDGEFVEQNNSAAELLLRWEEGWRCVFKTLDSLTADDLLKTIYIRGEAHSVVRAIQRQIAHYGQHVGQIIQIGKMIRKSEWKTLSIARGQSKSFKP